MRTRRWLPSCFALVAAMSLTFSANAQSLRIATYNVNFANQRGDQVMSAISEADPDLVCFQETTVQSEGFLKDQLKSSHPHFYSVGHEGKYYAERFAFASKSELTKLKYIPPTHGLFGFYMAQLRWQDELVQVVNVHLSPVQLQRGSGLSDALTGLSTVEAIHQNEIDAIVKEIDVDHPVIVLGDFNSISMYVAPTKLREVGMLDVFAALHADADNHPTWSWPTRPLPLNLRIDYIFCTRHFTATKAAVVRRVGSDHQLLMAVLNRTAPGDDAVKGTD